MAKEKEKCICRFALEKVQSSVGGEKGKNGDRNRLGGVKNLKRSEEKLQRNFLREVRRRKLLHF